MVAAVVGRGWHAELAGGYPLVIINTSIRPLCFRRHQARTTNDHNQGRYHQYEHVEPFTRIPYCYSFPNLANGSWPHRISTRCITRSYARTLTHRVCDISVVMVMDHCPTTAIASINRILQPTPQSTLTSLLTEWTSESNVGLQDARFKTTVCFNLLNVLDFVKLIWTIRWNLHVEL